MTHKLYNYLIILFLSVLGSSIVSCKRAIEPNEHYIYVNQLVEKVDTLKRYFEYKDIEKQISYDNVYGYLNNKPIYTKFSKDSSDVKLELNPNSDSTIYIFKSNLSNSDTLQINYSRSIEYSSIKNGYIMNISNIKFKKSTFKFQKFSYEESNIIYFLP